MKTKVEFTSEQLACYQAYEEIHRVGKYNMWDPHAREASGLTTEEFRFVMSNYSALKDAAGGSK